MFDILESDIVVMQELKIQRKDLRDDMVLIDGWDCYFSLPKHKKGYSGVGIYTRNARCAPIRAEEGLLGVLPSASGTAYRDLPEDEHIGGYPTSIQIAELGVDPALLDAEGRCVVVEFPAFVLFGVYSPANSNGLRDDFRYGFICALDCRIRNLIREGKNVVLVGDLNVTRHEMDSAATLEEIRKSQATREEFLMGPNRRVFNQLLIDGEVVDGRDEGRETGILWDTTRAFHPERKGMYTHWDTKINARPGNYGSRIDFVLVSPLMQPWIKDANIQEGLLGSDHCPVYVDFVDEFDFQGQEVKLLDIMSPPGHFEGGERKVEWKLSSTPGFSAKRLPEFDKRRSIKSMFAAPALKKGKTAQQSSSETPQMSEATAATTVPEDMKNAETPLESSTEAQRVDAHPKPGSQPSPVKRKPSNFKEQPSKRQKAETKTAAAPKGQQSLKGFFQAKNPPAATTAQQTSSENRAGVSATQDVEEDIDEATTAPQTPTSTQKSADQNLSPSPRQFAAQVASAEQSQKSWGALFAKPAAPLCEHSEPCKTMQTKKKGSNQGRSFWMCARPLGPSGEKERGTQWRCATFIWCSDWQPKKDGGAGSPVKSGAG